jgi:hypothetical protein
MRAVRIIIFLLVVTGLIWLVVVLFQNVFTNGNDTSNSDTELSLVSYADTDAVATMYIEGPVVANQDHNAVRIAIDRNQSSVEVIKGYDGQVVAQQVFPNTQASYLEFLSALDKSGYTKGNRDPDLRDDKGSCPFGNRYIYTLNDGTKDVLHYWTTNCSGGGGTYGGKSSLTRELFLRQIPEKDLENITKDIAL